MAVDDLWYLKKKDPETGKRLHSKRHGRGMRWRVRYVDDAGNKREQLFEKKSDADNFDAAVRSEINRGVYVDPTLGRQTIKGFGESWYAGLVFGRQNTEDNMERALRLHVYPKLGHRQLREVRRSHIQAWIKGLTHLAPRTVHIVYGFAVMLFNAAVLDKAIGSTPCIDIKLPAVVNDERPILTPKQVHDLARAFRPEYSAAIYVGVGCGLRQAEMAGLELDHVDFLHREITIKQQVVARRGHCHVLGPPKTSSSYRTVEMPKSTADALARHIELFPIREIEVVDATDTGNVHTRKAALLFPTPTGRLLSGGRWSAIWQPAARTAGIPDGEGYHLLRHYFATALIFAGANVKTVQLALGHSKPSITLDTYTGLWPDETMERTRHLIDASLGQAVLPAQRSRTGS
jgi:integrase